MPMQIIHLIHSSFCLRILFRVAPLLLCRLIKNFDTMRRVFSAAALENV